MLAVGAAWLLTSAGVLHADEETSHISEWPPRPAQPRPAPVASPVAAPTPQFTTMGSADASPSPTPTPLPSMLPSPSASPGANVLSFGDGRANGMRELQPGEVDNTVGAANDPRAGIGLPILAVRVINNTKTDSVTVEYLAGIKLGEPLSGALVDGFKQHLLNSELFKEVNVYWESYKKDGQEGVRIVLAAQDKLSWVLAPVASYSSNNYGGGAVFAHGNVFGHNKKLVVFGDYTTLEKLLFLAYLDPNILHTRFYYRVDALIRRDSLLEYAHGHEGNPRIERSTDLDTFGAALLGGVNITRRLHFDVRLKIYYDVVNPAHCYNTLNSDSSGTPDVVAANGGRCLEPSNSGWDNTLTTQLGYDGRARYYGVLDGLMLNLAWQYGPSWLGTKSDYHLLSFQGMYAFRFFQEHNWILKWGADVEFSPPFKMEIEAGGPELRGYLLRQFRGDTSLHFTTEYIVPLFTVLGVSLRAVGFFDTNLTWFRGLPAQSAPLSRVVDQGKAFRAFLPDTPSGVVRDSWHNDLGAGLRMYMRGVVLPLIGVDFAYGLESRSFQFYLSLGGTLN